MKKFISIVLAVLMLMSVAALSASAASVDNESTGTSGTIYFDASGWNNYSGIYCHIWSIGGDAFFDWQGNGELCEEVGGGVYAYDLSKVDSSTKVSGGIKSGVDYCVIFSANTGVQTYNTTFDMSCVDDMVVKTGNSVENPVDSEKTAYEAKWESSTTCGPHLEITSIGNIVGSKLGANESGAEAVGKWLVDYGAVPTIDVEAVLKEAYPKFGINTVEEINLIYAYVEENNVLLSEQNLKDIQGNLFNVLKELYPDEVGDKELDEVINEEKQKEAQNNVDQSGTGKDGADHTALFVILSVMFVAGLTVIATRKKRED